MKKWNLTGRKFMSVLLAVAMLAVMIPTALVEVANASVDYTEQNGEYYFWSEQGLRDLLADQQGRGDFNAHFAKSGSDLSEGDSLTITEDLTIYDKAGIHFGHADVSVAAGKTLTLQGRIEMDSWNFIKGPGTFVNQGAYLKVQDVHSGEQLSTLLDELALCTDDNGDRQSLHLKDRVDKTGNFTVPAGIELVVDGYLTVDGTLTVAEGAVVVNGGGVECEGLMIEEGAVFNNLNGWSNPVARDGADASVYFGDSLTVNGELYNNGVMNNGWRSGTSTVTVGATGTLFNWDTLGGSQSVNLIVDANAHVENYGEMAVSMENRGHAAEGEHICYNKPVDNENKGYINCVKTVTDGAEDDTAALLNAIAELNAVEDKKVYEKFSVYVRNAVENAPLAFTLTADVTIGREENNVDFLIVKQFGFQGTEGFAPAFTVAAGKTLTVNSVLFATAPVVVEGQLVVNNSYCRIANGFTVNGTLINRGKMDVNGEMTVGPNATVNVSQGWMSVSGKLTVDDAAKVIGGGENGDDFQVDYWRVVYDVGELTGALTDQLTDTVALDLLDQPAILMEDLTIPAGMQLHIWGGDNATFTVAQGAKLTLAAANEGQRESRLECGVPLIVKGALEAGARAEINLERGITGSGTVTNNGNFHINDGEPCGVSLTGDGQLWWRRVVDVTPNDNAAAALNDAMTGLNPDQWYDVFLNGVGNWTEDNAAVTLTGNVTVPGNVHLGIWDNPFYEIRVGNDATLIVDGGFYGNRRVVVDGGMVVNGDSNIECDVSVAGSLTVNKDARMWCRFLGNKVEERTGTITNNGQLFADQCDLTDPGVLSGGGEQGGGDDGWFRVESYDDLQDALNEHDCVRFEAEELTISDTLTVPKDVNLEICADKLTIAAGGKLEVKGNVNSHGKDEEQQLYLYGTIDTSYPDGWFDGQGTVEKGSRENIIPCAHGEGEDSWEEYRFTWRKVIQKSGNDTLTLEELNAAWNGNMVTGVGVEVAKNTVLTLLDVDEGNQLTTDNTHQLHFWGDDSATVIVPANVIWTDQGGFHSDAKVTVFGTLDLNEYANFNSDLLINGTVNVFRDMEMHGNIIMGDSGKLNLKALWNVDENDENNRWVERTGCVEFRDEDRDGERSCYWIELPEGKTDWDEFITFEEGAYIDVIEDVDYTNAAELQAAMIDFSDRSHRFYLHNKTDNVWLNVNAGETLTIPENITLCVNSWDGFTGICVSGADEREDWGVLTVNGKLESNVLTVVNGYMTVKGRGHVNVWENPVQVGGDLTVDANGDMNCYYLTDKGEIWGDEGFIRNITGTITNNGWLHIDVLEPGTVIGGSGITKWERFSTVSTMEELKAALNAAAVTDEEREIRISMTDEQREGYDPETDGVVRFVIDDDIIIPANVRLVMDDQSGYAGVTVASSATLSVNGRIDFRGQGDWLDVEGTLINDKIMKDGKPLCRGEINAKGICVKSGGVLTNNGHLEAYTDIIIKGEDEDTDKDAGQLLNHDFIRANGVDVQGHLENNCIIELRGIKDLQDQWHPGSISVGGTMVNNSNLDNMAVDVHSGGVLTNNGFMNLKFLENNGNIINNKDHAIRFEDCGNGNGTVTGDGWFGWVGYAYTVAEVQKLMTREGRGAIQWDLPSEGVTLTDNLTVREGVELVVGTEWNDWDHMENAPALVIPQGVTFTVNGELVEAMPKMTLDGTLVNNGHMQTYFDFTVTDTGELVNNSDASIRGWLTVYGKLTQGEGGELFADAGGDYILNEYCGRINLKETAVVDFVNGNIGCKAAGEASIQGLPAGYRLTEMNQQGDCWVVADEQPPQPGLLPGDVNGDSVVNDTDLTLLLRHVAQIEYLPGEAMPAADFNGDTRVDADDLTDMVNYLDTRSASGGGSTVVETSQTG